MTEMVLRKNRSPQRLDGLAQTLYKSKLRGEQDPAKPLNYWHILEHKSDMERERVLSMRSAVAGRINIWLAVLALLSGLAVSLAGCSGGSLGGVFGGSGEGATSSNVPSIAFAPIIGPPAAIGKYLNGQLVAAVQQKKITVVADIDKTATYTVQGFLAQSNEAKSEKFSYIWDVRDKSGNRVHRILGEEAVPAKTGAKPWSSINNAALQKIAAKTAEDLAVWLPKQGAAAATPAARSTPAAQHPPARSSSRTASTGTGKKRIAILVSPVSGAPGDGRTTLANAIRRQLAFKGIHIARNSGSNIYKINGKVTMGKGKTAKTQSVRIDWQLLSSTGDHLGTVEQKSEVPKGSLDRSWGAVALSAGNAAATEIIKMIAKGKS